MFFDFPDDFKAVEPFPGWLVHIAAGQRLSFSRIVLQPNIELPMHAHPNEQMGIVLEGAMELTIGDETRLVKKGGVYLVPPNVTHGGSTREEGALVLDAFSPPRDYK